MKKDNSQIISMLERVMTEMKLEIPVQPKEKQEEEEEEDCESDSDNERKEDSTNLKDTTSKHFPHRNSGRRPSFEEREEGKDVLNVLKEDKQEKDNDGKNGDSEKQEKEEVATSPMHSEQQEGIELKHKHMNNTSNRI